MLLKGRIGVFISYMKRWARQFLACLLSLSVLISSTALAQQDDGGGIFPEPPSEEEVVPVEQERPSETPPAQPTEIAPAKPREIPPQPSQEKKQKAAKTEKLPAQQQEKEIEEPPQTPAQSTAAPARERPAQQQALQAPELAKITVALDNVNLTTFLQAISRQSKVNFIVSEGLEEKRITAFLDGVTLEQALQVLLGIKGLAYEKIPGKTPTYLISPRRETKPRTVTRIFELQFIPLQDIGAISAVGEEVSQVSSAFETGAPPAGVPAPGQPGAQQGNSGQGIIEILQTLVSSYGRIAVDARTNSIIITDLPENFSQIESLIRSLDKKSPQVMIEAQIVEINSDGLKRVGLEFGGPQGEIMRFIGPSRYTDYLLRSDGKFNHFWPSESVAATAFAVPGAVNVGVAQGGTGITYGALSFNEFQVLLRAIVTKTRGKILARPKIMTVNNKLAEIRITANQAIGVASVSAGLGSTGSSAERQQTGLILRVTPQVNGDNYITIVVEPKLTRVVPSLVSSSLFDPITRAVKSMVRVKNGDTIVIGGLLDTREEKVTRKVPLLGSIPILGWLFTNQTTQKLNSELAIFLTPTIAEAQ